MRCAVSRTRSQRSADFLPHPEKSRPRQPPRSAATGADLGFITSPFVYDTIIQPNPGPVGPVFYHQLKCQVRRLYAWMYLAQASGEIQPTAANVSQIG
jgi:hypothetical protein